MEVSLDAESRLAVVRAVVCEHADYKECTVWHRMGIACKVLCVTHFFFSLQEVNLYKHKNSKLSENNSRTHVCCFEKKMASVLHQSLSYMSCFSPLSTFVLQTNTDFSPSRV